jgi:hypothetical protein
MRHVVAMEWPLKNRFWLESDQRPTRRWSPPFTMIFQYYYSLATLYNGEMKCHFSFKEYLRIFCNSTIFCCLLFYNVETFHSQTEDINATWTFIDSHLFRGFESILSTRMWSTTTVVPSWPPSPSSPTPSRPLCPRLWPSSSTRCSNQVGPAPVGTARGDLAQAIQ